MIRTLLTSTQSGQRLEALRRALREHPADQPLTLLAHSTEAAASLVRSLGRSAFGWRRSTLFRHALTVARGRLLREARVPASALAVEALWARVVHQLATTGGLGRLEPIARAPGLIRALARTAFDLRMSGASAETLEPALQAALREYQAALDRHGLADRALVLRYAAEAVSGAAGPLVLLDVEVQHRLEAEFTSQLAGAHAQVLAVAPANDLATVRALEHALAVKATGLGERPTTPLRALQAHLFRTESGSFDQPWNDLLSAPGEARECVELVRIIRDEARTGVPFDQMAVLLRAPAVYRAHVEAAFRRAAIPAFFAGGTPRPDPVGRAFLSLLKCAEEGLSARAFAEYASLGQVPNADAAGSPPTAVPREHRYARPEDEDCILAPEQTGPEQPTEAEPVDVEAPVVAGALRAPRRWEALLVDAAVIGGSDRWRRRLAGLLRRKEVAAAAPDLTEAHQLRLQRELADLKGLQSFALPLLDELAALPQSARWGVWLDQLSALACRALKEPTRVLAVLQELAPMAVIGPVGLREVRAVLSPRLAEITSAPSHRPEGRVFVGPIETARGLAFEVVLVPGLVERVFPQKLREDPLLPDRVRTSIGLPTNEQRVAGERLALQLAVGAAKRRVVLSYPRVDTEHARPRVPSFYALETLRAVEGRLLNFGELEERAEQAGASRLGWPAPKDPRQAIDETEHDLAVLDDVFRSERPARGRARYLVDAAANPHLARALRSRFARWAQRKWTPWDGLVNPPAEALANHQLSARAFSPTSLQLYSACPYRFFLSAVQRLAPFEIPDIIEQLGPLERGSMTHEVQFRLMSALREAGRAVSETSLGEVFGQLNQVLEEVASDFHDEFVPAIDRIWHDGLETIRADLREWLRRVARDERWRPWRFELSFGLGSQRPQQDPSSSAAAVRLDNGLQLRGSIDLVERDRGGALRATDYKTGKARAAPGNVVGGGHHLQPLLYAMALEKLLPGHPVEGGRLSYCTQAGGFLEVVTPVDATARRTLDRVVNIIGDALTYGFFPAAPQKGECRYCDFRVVCGPDEERRSAKKHSKPLEPLFELRALP